MKRQPRENYELQPNCTQKNIYNLGEIYQNIREIRNQYLRIELKAQKNSSVYHSKELHTHIYIHTYVPIKIHKCKYIINIYYILISLHI